MRKVMMIFIGMILSIIICGNAKAFAEYTIGDTVTLNSEKYYVIENSDANKEYITVLKEKPLTVEEVNNYGEGHINRYTMQSQNTANNQNGYGGMSFYNSESCGYVNEQLVDSQCPKGQEEIYSISDIKYVIDNWAADKFNNNELVEVDGYNARLIKKSELIEQLGCAKRNDDDQNIYCNISSYSWIYSSDYWYWTMDKREGANNMQIWYVNATSSALNTNESYHGTTGLVRPVINVSKKIFEESTNSKDNDVIVDNNKTSKENVNVENTFLNKSFFTIIVGFAIVIIGIIIYIINQKKK